jgi:hypothetical protein
MRSDTRVNPSSFALSAIPAGFLQSAIQKAQLTIYRLLTVGKKRTVKCPHNTELKNWNQPISSKDWEVHLIMYLR